MSVPGQSFTLRYYELRTLLCAKSVNVLKLQTSFAVNRRRYERWRDIDVPSSGTPDRRHAFVRRCASFWTSQSSPSDGEANDEGWDGKASETMLSGRSLLTATHFSCHPSRSRLCYRMRAAKDGVGQRRTGDGCGCKRVLKKSRG